MSVGSLQQSLDAHMHAQKLHMHHIRMHTKKGQPGCHCMDCGKDCVVHARTCPESLTCHTNMYMHSTRHVAGTHECVTRTQGCQYTARADVVCTTARMLTLTGDAPISEQEGSLLCRSNPPRMGTAQLLSHFGSALATPQHSSQCILPTVYVVVQCVHTRAQPSRAYMQHTDTMTRGAGISRVRHIHALHLATL